MKPLTWTKQPSESRILEIDCNDTLPPTVTISSLSVKIYDSGAVDQSASMIQGAPSNVGATVYAQVKAGTNGANYNCQVKLTLSNGEIAEDDIKIYVREQA